MAVVIRKQVPHTFMKICIEMLFHISAPNQKVHRISFENRTYLQASRHSHSIIFRLDFDIRISRRVSPQSSKKKNKKKSLTLRNERLSESISQPPSPSSKKHKPSPLTQDARDSNGLCRHPALISDSEARYIMNAIPLIGQNSNCQNTQDDQCTFHDTHNSIHQSK